MCLSFASLLFVAVQPAEAYDPIAEVTEDAAPEATLLAARWSHEIVGRELVVKLHVRNTGDEPVEMLVARGRLPGPDVQANIAGAALDRLFTPDELSGRMSRMGPMPRFAPLAERKEILAGTYRFQLPEGYRDAVIELVADVRTDEARVQLRTQVGAPLGV